METFEKIELRRFVGRELLLFLWFESELLDATLSTAAHGSFGMWVEKRLVLSAGQETTTIKGSSPGNHREAKEALLRGKLPDLATFHLSWGDKEASFTLRGETLAIAGLKLPKPGGDDAPASTTVEAKPRPRRAKRRLPDGADAAQIARARAAAAEADTMLAYDELGERIRLAREIEEILEALYRDFLALRLGDAWAKLVLPAIEAWTAGEEVDADAYASARAKALGGTARARAV